MQRQKDLTQEILKRIIDIRAPNQRDNLLLAGHYHGIKEYCLYNTDLAKLEPDDQDAVIEQIVQQYKGALVRPGEPVGLLAAQSLGELYAQATLNTHRSAGISSARKTVDGLTQFENLVELKEKNSANIIFLKNMRGSHGVISAIPLIENIIIGDIVERTDLIDSDNTTIENYAEDLMLDLLEIDIKNKQPLDTNTKIGKSSKILRLYMKKYEMYSRRISMSHIASLIEQVDSDTNTRVVYTDISTGIIDIYYNEDYVIKRLGETYEGRELFHHYNNILFPALQELQIAGVEGIKKVYASYIAINNAFKDYIDPKDEDDVLIFRFHKFTLDRYGIDDEHISDYIKTRVVISGGNKSVQVIKLPPMFDPLDTYKMYKVKNIGIGYIESDTMGIKKAMKLGKYMDIVSITDKVDDGTNDTVLCPKLFDFIEGSKPLITTEELASVLTSRYYNDIEIDGNNVRLKNVPYDDLKETSVTSNFLEETSEKWFLESEGTNLTELLSLSFVDSNATYSTSPREMFSVLGIKALRNHITHTLMESGQVHYHHLSLVADTITYRGFPIPMTRLGSAKQDFGFIAKLSNEETTTQMYKAATFGMSEDIEGLAAKIFVGALSNFGSGYGEPEEIHEEEAITDLMKKYKKERATIASTLTGKRKTSAFSIEHTKKVLREEKNLPDVL